MYTSEIYVKTIIYTSEKYANTIYTNKNIPIQYLYVQVKNMSENLYK